MSMHKKPLTRLEEEGLRAHGLPIGTPSQLSDVFRHGIAWAATQNQPEVQRLREALEGVLEYFPEGASDGECFAVDAARAALSAQQSAPEQVNVPVELAARLQRFCQRPHSSRDEADDLDMELRALLASTGQEAAGHEQ